MEVHKFLNKFNWISSIYIWVLLDNGILAQSQYETCTVAVQAYNTDQDTSNLGLITLKKSLGATSVVLSFRESTWKFYVWAIISASCYPVARGTYPLYRADGDLDLTSIRDQQALADALEAAVESAAQLQGVLVVASINGRGPFLGKMAEFASKYRITDTSEGDFFTDTFGEQDTLVLLSSSTTMMHKYILNGHGPQRIEYTFKHQDGEVFAAPVFRDLDQFDEETVGLLVVYAKGPYGGLEGGVPYTDACFTDHCTEISKIDVWQLGETYISSIQVTYGVLTAPEHGLIRGELKSITLEPDEYIMRVSGEWTRDTTNTYSLLSSINFYTNKGNKLEIPSLATPEKRFDTGHCDKCALNFISGRSGDFLNNAFFHFCEPVEMKQADVLY